MDWGLVIAIIGAIIIALGVILYFSSRASTFTRLINSKAFVPLPSDATKNFMSDCCGSKPPFPVVGGELTINQASELLRTSPWAIGMWVIGGGLFAIGIIVMIVNAYNRNKSKTLEDLLPDLIKSIQTPKNATTTSQEEILKSLTTKAKA